MPTLYVIAGPNGIGKTTSSYSVVPKDIAIINSDEIAKELRKEKQISLNVLEISNEKAISLMEEQRNQKKSFAVETNLSDVDTWKFLMEMKKTGYDLHIIFMSASSLTVLNNRISERVKQGDHYVNPEIVEERYISGLNLLNHYFDQPDKLQLFDNLKELLLVLEVSKGNITYKAELLPEWVTEYLAQHLNESKVQKVKISDLDNIEQVRQSYKAIRQNTESDKFFNGQKQSSKQMESLKDDSITSNQSEEQINKKRIRKRPKH